MYYAGAPEQLLIRVLVRLDEKTKSGIDFEEAPLQQQADLIEFCSH
jgi:hypothetical protein